MSIQVSLYFFDAYLNFSFQLKRILNSDFRFSNKFSLKKDGHVPLLSNGKKFHFHLCNHEKQKHIALDIASALQDIGFKVWISQHQAAIGNSADKEAMHQGVRESECILLCMTKGIFHHDRFLLTEVGIRYGIEKCDL